MVDIKAGEKYVCANGHVVGPIEDNDSDDFPWRNPTGAHPVHRFINWTKDGKIATLNGSIGNFDRAFAIVSEFSKSPIREITRKEIVPGVYGQLKIGEIVNVPDCDRPDAPVALYAYVNFREACMTADELDAAASVLTQIAAVLREDGGS